MWRNWLISIFCLLTFLAELSGQISVSEQANKDQAAGKLWSALGNNLTRKLGCPISNVPELLVGREDLSENHLKWFLSYFLNYNVEALDLSQIHYRYPHYNEMAIQRDMDHFIQLGLIIRGANGWILEDQGAAIIDDYWEFKLKEASACEEESSHIIVLNTIARKVIAAYDEIQGLPSVRLRIRNRPSGFEDFPALLKAFVFQQELSAVFNDIGHHRFDYLSATEAEEWTKWELSPLAKELMGATRNDRVYEIERCYNQPFWRVEPQICDGAVKELFNLGLIEMRPGQINQTNLGKQYFQAADDLADDLIYSAWDKLSQEEYESFKNALEWLQE